LRFDGFRQACFFDVLGGWQKTGRKKKKKQIVDEKLDRRGSQGEEIIIHGVPLSSGSGHFA
jgi:hypothetical protein